MQACAAAGIQYVEVPIAFDGLTVVTHPSNPVRTVTIAELRRTWEPAAERRISNWRQINPTWPDLELQLFGAGTASGGAVRRQPDGTCGTRRVEPCP